VAPHRGRRTLDQSRLTADFLGLIVSISWVRPAAASTEWLDCFSPISIVGFPIFPKLPVPRPWHVAADWRGLENSDRAFRKAPGWPPTASYATQEPEASRRPSRVQRVLRGLRRWHPKSARFGILFGGGVGEGEGDVEEGAVGDDGVFGRGELEGVGTAGDGEMAQPKLESGFACQACREGSNARITFS
jgi:hypothetical protein